MKGFVPTPPMLVDIMVEKLFRGRQPSDTDRLLDPGCGTGAFIQGVLRWCNRNSSPIPAIIGIESDPALFGDAKRAFAGVDQVSIQLADFLGPANDEFDFIIGNPPYVAITDLTVGERERWN